MLKREAYSRVVTKTLRSGAPHRLGTFSLRSHRPLSNEQIRGIALIVVMLLDFLMTWLLGVMSGPMQTITNFSVGCAVVVLHVLGRED